MSKFSISSQINKSANVGTSTGVYPLGSEAFLREFPNSSGSYSTRKLSTKPTDVMRVRRSSDNAEQDFNANEVKGSGLLDWVGVGNDGLVPKLLDQRVPTNKDYMYFDGVDDYVDISTLSATLQTKTKGRITGSFNLEGVNENIFSFSDAANGGTDLAVRLLSDGKFHFVVRNNHIISLRWDSTASYDDGLDHTFDITVSDTGSTILIDGVAGVGTYPSGNASTKKWFSDASSLDFGGIGANKDSAGFEHYVNGVVYDITVYDEDATTKIAEWVNTGNTNADWLDQVGSNNGTVYGSPQRVLNSDFTKISRDFSQSTAGSQPQIIDNGALVTENTKPMLDFDGSASHLRCPASEFITPTTALQVSIVCKNDSATLGSTEYIIGQYDSGVSKRSWVIVVDANEKLIVSFGDPSDGTFEGSWVSDNAISPEDLQTIGFTYNAGTVQLKVNGSNVAGSIGSGAIPATLYNSNSDATIGCALNSNSTTNFWDGQIAEIYVADNLTDNLADIQVAQMKAFNIT